MKTKKLITLFAVSLLSFFASMASAQTQSSITIGGTDYTLFTGFTATGGTTTSYSNFVDGNTSTTWAAYKGTNFAGGESDPAFVEFHSDVAFIPKGYILTNNTVNKNWTPTSWALKAKLTENDNWTVIHSSNTALGNSASFELTCSNDGNNLYQYFRFEIYDVGTTYWSKLNELQFYGSLPAYTHLTVKAATCTETGIKQDCYRRNSDGKYFSDEACTQKVTADEVLKGIFGTLTAGTNGASGYYTLESKTYTLTEDVNTAGYIYVPEGVTATIDLAGHTIDRGLTSAVENGMVIWVAGSLTVTDRSTGGKIKGGMDDDNTVVSCVKVYSDNGDAAFTLQGGTLIGNTSSQYSIAVFGYYNTNITISGGKITGDVYGILSMGNVTVSGGEISGNTTGILSRDNSVSVSGNPVIKNNTNANVMLYYEAASILTIAGELTAGANIGITIGGFGPTDNAPVTITSGYGTYNNNVSPSTYFSLDNNGQIQTGPSEYMTLVMGWNEDQTEIAVGTAMRTVTFDLRGHGSAIDAVSLLSGYKLIEPTEPTAEGWSFGGWFTDEDCTEANEWDFANSVTSDLTLYALWNQGQTYRVTLPEKMIIVSTDNEAVGGKYPSGTNIRFKVAPDYVVDGDVKNGEDVLTADGDGIYTITVADANITITATVKKAAEPNKTLSGSESYTAQEGDVLTGSTSGTVTIANNANITLSDVTITGGIVCDGTATITLVGDNIVTGVNQKAGIQVGGSGTTLTIKGNGSLTANGGQHSAGIGLSRVWGDFNATGGDIVIEGGTITAIGGNWGAGIGTGVVKNTKNDNTTSVQFGNITIKGGSVTAIGGDSGDGIGKGYAYSGPTIIIGTVTIYDDINLVDASSIKDFANVVYMHGENNVTENKADYFTIGEDGNRRVIEPKVTTIGALTLKGITATLNGNYTADATPVTIASDISVNSVTIDRTFQSGVTSTIILPFSVESGKYSGGTFYEFTSVDYKNGKWEASMTKVTGKIEAHKPYLFKPSSDKLTITGSVTLEATSEEEYSVTKGYWSFNGVFKVKNWATGVKRDYFFASTAATSTEGNAVSAGDFVRIGNECGLSPFRCYLSYTGSESSLTKSDKQLPSSIEVRLIDEIASVVEPENPESPSDNCDIVTPVSEITPDSGVKVWSYNRTIYIESQPGTDYTVVDLNGRTLTKGVTRSTREEVTLCRATGIVIVKVNGKTFKIY